METEVSDLRSTPWTLESRATVGSNHAPSISLVRRGQHLEELRTTCGEAELVYVLHGPAGGLN